MSNGKREHKFAHDVGTMSSQIGQRLLAVLAELQTGSRWSIIPNMDSDSGSRWHLRGTTWKSEVIIRPKSWLGMTIEVAHPDNNQRVTYAIDSDLYDISRDKERAFALNIESAIIEFIVNLDRGQVLSGRSGNKFGLVFPSGGSFTRVVAGRFATTASTHARLDDAKLGGTYFPVV